MAIPTLGASELAYGARDCVTGEYMLGASDEMEQWVGALLSRARAVLGEAAETRPIPGGYRSVTWSLSRVATEESVAETDLPCPRPDTDVYGSYCGSRLTEYHGVAKNAQFSFVVDERDRIVSWSPDCFLKVTRR
jgi:hypothetical protein